MNSLRDMSSDLRCLPTVIRLRPTLEAICVFGTSSSKAFTRRLFTAEAAALLADAIMVCILAPANK